jgi:hypothetical protein
VAWWRRRQTDQAWRVAADRVGSASTASSSRRASGTLTGTSSALESAERLTAGRVPFSPRFSATQGGQEGVGQQREGDVAIPAVVQAHLTHLNIFG